MVMPNQPELPPQEVRAVPSDALCSEDLEPSLGGTGATGDVLQGTTNLVKDIGIRARGSYRVRFNLRRPGGSAEASAIIVRHRGDTRVAVGTHRGSTSNAATSYTEDIPGWQEDDELELHAGNSDATSSHCSVAGLIVMGSLRLVDPPAYQEPTEMT